MLISALSIAVVVILGPGDLNDDKKLRLDALKLVLAGVAGYGAAVTVWLALRRQQHLEHEAWAQRQFEARKQAAGDRDAEARRALELYSAATQQLASEQAPIRMAGLYTFERLADENPAYRQTVLDVFCAYLRMRREFDRESDVAAEQEVRATTQSLVLRHLRHPDNDIAWPGMRVNLAGALLRDLDASHTYFEDATFDGATFEGITSFNRARFMCPGRFKDCNFAGWTAFRKVRFEQGCTYEGAKFFGVETGFTATQFRGDMNGATRFRQAEFHATQTVFRGAKFSSANSTNFSKAIFRDTTANFSRTTYESGVTTFNGAEFASDAEPFMKAKFSERLIVDNFDRWKALLKGAHILGPIELPGSSRSASAKVAGAPGFVDPGVGGSDLMRNETAGVVERSASGEESSTGVSSPSPTPGPAEEDRA